MVKEDYPFPPENDYTWNDVYFKAMSEEESIRVFREDGYTKWQTRQQRYKRLPKTGLFATKPSNHWVMYLKQGNKPIGVLGFAEHKGFLLGSGIHVREGYRQSDRKKGAVGLLIDKLIKEKGDRTLLASFTSRSAMRHYTAKGFHPIKQEDIPEDILDELSIAEASGNVGTLQKYIGSKWWITIKGV